MGRYGHRMRAWEWIGPVAVAVVAAVLVGLRRRGRRVPEGPPARPAPRVEGPRPRAREIWWAEVPFEDGPGSKDRPCLVIRVGPRTATVLKITSKHHVERPGVLPLPPGTVGDRGRRASWLETDEPREVEFHAFRRRVGVAEPSLWRRVQAVQRR